MAEEGDRDDSREDRLQVGDQRRLGRADATVEKRLRFGTLRVRVTQERLEDLCAIGDVASIETDNTIGLTGDSGDES